MADRQSPAPIGLEIAAALHRVAEQVSLPDQFQKPMTAISQAKTRRRHWKARIAAMAGAVIVTVTTTGLALAAYGGWPWSRGPNGPTDAEAALARQTAESDALALAATVRAAEAASAEKGELNLSEPVSPATVVDPFGPRRRPGGAEAGMHTGVDFSVRVGDAVHAAADGVVTAAGSYPALGGVVVITHGKVNGAPVSTWYEHNQEVAVHVGQQVKAGEVIALAGDSGAVTGPNLHFEVRVSGIPVDPLTWMKH